MEARFIQARSPRDKQAVLVLLRKKPVWMALLQIEIFNLYSYLQQRLDIQSGLINKVAITPANITDARGIAHVLPPEAQFMLIKVILLL